MSLGEIKKQTADIYGKKDRKKTLNGERIIESVLIICIVITSLNLTYWLVPTFLSISFVLLQLRKISNKIAKK